MTPTLVSWVLALVLPAVPGAINPNVTQANLHRTVCRVGYSDSIRPPYSYTKRLKIRQIAALGYKDRNPRHYQEDHLISLSLGGSPRSPLNLWPEPLAQARRSDPYEHYLHRLLCDGDVSLRFARVLIVQQKVTKG